MKGPAVARTAEAASAAALQEARGAPRRADPTPLTIKAGDQDSNRLRVVIEALSGLEASVQSVNLQPDCWAWPGDPATAVVIALGQCPSPDHPSLGTIARFRQMGSAVIAFEDNVRAWPVDARCRVLLAGANQLLDSRDADFAALLRVVVAAELVAAQNNAVQARDTMMLAERHGFIGGSAATRDVFRQVIRISQLSDLPVLIVGESGTGKELVGTAIRALDPKRRAFPFVAVNCAAISTNLAESELFGYVRGAFTGATTHRKGYFVAAQGGVLFLDEIGELSLDMQAKLLRVLEQREVLQVGSDRALPIDVRVIAATNRDLATLAAEGRFRADLLFRLNVLSVRISPLRERLDDLRPLAEHFANAAWASVGRMPRGLDADLVDALALLPLHGNARELRNLIFFAVAHKADDGPLGLRDLSPDLLRQLSLQRTAHGDRRAGARVPAEVDLVPVPPPTMPGQHQWRLAEYLARCERDFIAAAMRQTCNNQTEAARLLGVTPRSIYNKLRKHRLAVTGPRG